MFQTIKAKDPRQVAAELVDLWNLWGYFDGPPKENPRCVELGKFYSWRRNIPVALKKILFLQEKHICSFKVGVGP